jgi:hypothetical protein
VLTAADVSTNYAFGPDLASGPVTLVRQPRNGTSVIGGAARFTASASGSVPIRYQWFRNGAALTGATNNSLTITNATWADDGAAFQLVASNLFNSTSCAATSSVVSLTVLSAGDALTHRYSFTSNANDSVGTAHGTLQGAASLSGGRVTLNGTSGTYVNLPGGLIAGGPAVTIEAWCSLGVNVNWIRLFDMGSTNGVNGQYDLYFCPRSGAGDYRLTIMDPQPSERIVNFAGNLDSRANLHVACVLDPVTGFMGVYLDGELAAARWDLTSLDSVATNLFYLGRSLFASDGWLNGSIDEFRIYGGALGAAQIAVNSSRGPNLTPARAVRILSAPQSRTNYVHTTASFSVTPNDCGPVAAQWQCGAAGLSGQTNLTLELPDVQPGDAGDYSVVLSNTVRTVTSPPARLVVLPLPRLDAVWHSASNHLGLRVAGDGGSWTIQSSTNLTAWNDLTNLPAQTGTIECALPVSPGTPAQFYRLKLND